MALNITQASDLLSEYLSTLFRVPIGIPIVDLTDHQQVISVGEFLKLLPIVVQKAVDGSELIFALPLVAQGKGTTLNPAIANVVNTLLFEGKALPDAVFEVPTFFYPDGSAMIIRFWPRNLFDAVYALTKNQRLEDFVTNGIKGAHHAP